MHTLRKCSNVFASLMIAALLALAVAGAAPAVQKPVSALTPTMFVKPTGLDTNTCKSPALACKTINAALGKATAGATIKVAVGSYTATAGTEVVWIKKGITLSGGWNNAFTAQTGRSTIDGKNLRRGVRINAGLTVTVDRFQIQNGHSTVGGGIWSAGTLTLSNSVVTHNSAPAGYGGGIWSPGGLTVNSSTISYNTGGGGLQASGAVVINNSTFDHNTPQAIGQTGAGLTINGSTISNSAGRGISSTSTVTLNNSTVSGTVGNATYTDGSGVESTGTLILYNATITKNYTGVKVDAGTATLTNTIVAANSSDGGTTANDCAGTLTSNGYNLIGSTSSCTFTPTTGDLTGTSGAVLDAKLSALADHGGPTLTHALSSDSPAVDAGNPGTCLATDQRGYTRPIACDMGAYELFTLGAYSIKRLSPDNTSAGTVRFAVVFNELVVGVDVADFVATTTGTVTGATVTAVAGSGETYTVTVNTGSGDGTLRLDLIDNDTILGTYNDDPLGGVGTGNGDFTTGEVYTLVNPSVVSVNRATAEFTSATTVNFTVIFSTPVTGVNLVAPFSDFHVTTDGLTGAKVTAVAGSGKNYMVTVNHGLGSGTVRLDVADDDTIADSTSGRKLGGTGLANGDFTAGQTYDIVPMPQAPTGAVWDTTPTFRWAKLAGVTQYQYQLLDGVTPVYTISVASTVCGTTTCSHTPTTVLPPKNTYNWSVQAYSGGVWRDYSPAKPFSLYEPKPGYWDNPSSVVSFYVTPTGTQLKKLTLYMYECSTWWYLEYKYPVAVTLGKFTLSTTGPTITIKGSFAVANGFSTNASGTASYTNLSFPCGTRSRSGSWSNYWQNSNQPAIATLENAGPMLPEPLGGTLTLERMTP